jgi:hypothetical protein
MGMAGGHGGTGGMCMGGGGTGGIGLIGGGGAGRTGSLDGIIFFSTIFTSFLGY